MLRGKKIFILEDNTLNRVVYQISLGKQGAFLKFDRWGHETISKLSTDFDIMILDLMLPNGNSGFDVFTQIRECEEYNHIPIVAVSAAEPAIAIPKVMDLGFVGFISKPIDAITFPKQILQIINGEQIWDS